MIGVVFASLTSIWILLSGYTAFSSSAFTIFKKDFSRQARTNTTAACLTYGDLLARAGEIDNIPSNSIPDKITLNLGCLASNEGTCAEPISCTISITGGNKINVE